MDSIAAFNVNKMHISKNYILSPIKSIQTTHNSKKITSQKNITRKLLFRVNTFLFCSTKWEGNSSLWPLDWYVPHSERNVLFNDALNTFYLRLYGVRHMVKDNSDSEKGNPLPPHRLLLSINSKGYFICTIPQTGYHIPRPLLHQSWSTGWNEK